MTGTVVHARWNICGQLRIEVAWDTGACHLVFQADLISVHMRSRRRCEFASTVFAHSPRAIISSAGYNVGLFRNSGGNILRAPAFVVVVRAAKALAAAMSGRRRKLMNLCASSGRLLSRRITEQFG